ncbi:MAG: 1-deoxy-D-xylulose-5-phosphate reductoisomerase, partial [Kiritimatiellaeota bacterium]|nr:1-deoxy-D-xylulose-5-phosphate reductoisomerase [Kiritimatiellota bacterium]
MLRERLVAVGQHNIRVASPEVVLDNIERAGVVFGGGIEHAEAAGFGVEPAALGADGAEQLVRDVPADVVLNGITGSSGLGPTLAALECGRTLALANKESLIVGGELVTSLAA